MLGSPSEAMAELLLRDSPPLEEAMPWKHPRPFWPESRACDFVKLGAR
jgi:hypothetical protein